MSKTLIATAAALVIAASFAATDASAMKGNGSVGGVSASKKIGCHWGKDANGNLVLICG